MISIIFLLSSLFLIFMFSSLGKDIWSISNRFDKAILVTCLGVICGLGMFILPLIAFSEVVCK